MSDFSRSKVFLLRFLVFVCKRLATTHLWAEYDFQINIKSLNSWLMPHEPITDWSQTSFWKSFLYFHFPWSPVWLEYSARLICHTLSKFLLIYSKKALLEPSRWWTVLIKMECSISNSKVISTESPYWFLSNLVQKYWIRSLIQN